MELLYFSDIDQIDYVLNNQPQLLDRKYPITGDMVVSYEFETRGIDFIDEWELLSEQELKKNQDTAYVLSREWWDESIFSTMKYGFQYTDAACQDLIYSLECALNARTVYSKVFSKYPVSEIAGFFLPPVAVIRTGPAPTSRAVTSISQAVLYFLAERNNVPITTLNYTKTSKPKKKNRSKSVAKRDRPPMCDFPNSEERRVILIYRDSMYPSEYMAIVDAAGRAGGIEVIPLTRELLQNCFEFDGNNYSHSEFIPKNELLKHRVENYRGEYAEIFGNPYLIFQFERIWREIESATRCGIVFEEFVKLVGPSLFIVGHDAFTFERVLVRIAKKHDVVSAGIIHGGMGTRNGFRGIVGEVDRILVWNDEDIDILSSFGYEKTKFAKIGAIRYQTLFDEYKERQKKRFSKECSTQETTNRTKNTRPQVSILTAEVNTGFAAPIANPRKYRTQLRNFVHYIKSHPEIDFVIKPHPSFDYFDLYRRLASADVPNLRIIEGDVLASILQTSDLCILLNYCTTAALEAMLFAVPVLYLNGAVYQLDDWRDNFSIEGILRSGTVESLCDDLERTIGDEVFRRNLLGKADGEVRRILDEKILSQEIYLPNLLSTLITRRDALPESQFLSRKNESSKNISIKNSKSDALNLETKCSELYITAYISGLHQFGFDTTKNKILSFTNSSRIGSPEMKQIEFNALSVYIDGYINSLENRVNNSILSFYSAVPILFVHYVKNRKSSNIILKKIVKSTIRYVFAKRA